MSDHASIVSFQNLDRENLIRMVWHGELPRVGEHIAVTTAGIVECWTVARIFHQVTIELLDDDRYGRREAVVVIQVEEEPVDD